ncbi:hypothetical protein [Parabacteroides faecis]|uniref:hypothetical protein n=1 Tax=Parabacteroides faecis TaxID=1217282 RepID=UPI00216509EE|nr:hypothetical protein [Parabacteroides faecis]MCS2891168.1 hypothetical protein [Parabacteroides faecis]
MVNFPSYQVSNIAMASDSRLIKVKEVKAEDASSLKGYDAILLFGPGLRLTEEQTENIDAAGKKRNRCIYLCLFIRLHQQSQCRQPATGTTRYLL